MERLENSALANAVWPEEQSDRLEFNALAPTDALEVLYLNAA